MSTMEVSTDVQQKMLLEVKKKKTTNFAPGLLVKTFIFSYFTAVYRHLSGMSIIITSSEKGERQY